MDLNIKVYQLANGFQSDALHKQESTGHPYIACSKFLQQMNLSYLRVWKDEIIKTFIPIQIQNFPDGTLIQNGFERTIYIIKNNSLHTIPDLQTFTSMGLDFSNVKRITKNEFLLLTMGEDINQYEEKVKLLNLGKV